jgi:hypothetical protein
MGLAKEMNSGNWMLNGQPLVFSDEGRLLDGQHRLMAIEEADISILMDIRFGVENDSFKTIDQGKGRSAGDVLGIIGIPNYTNTAAAAKMIMIYIQSGALGDNLNRWQRISNTEIMEWVNNNKPEITKAVKDASALYASSDRLILTTSKIAAFLFITKRLNADAGKFWEQLCSGILESKGTVSSLRTKLIRSKMDKSRRLTSALERHYVVKSWNAWAEGKELSKLVNSMDSNKGPDLFN